MLQNLADRAIVGHDEALEVPLLAQHVGHHPMACRGRHIVDKVERRHDASHTSVDHSLIGRQKLVVHAYLAHVGGVVLLACLNGSIEGEMLETSHDVVFGDDGLTAHVSLLIAASHGCSQDTTEVWILAEAFADASPAGIESHVDHRREGPVDAVGACLACRHSAHLSQSFLVPRAGEGERYGEDGFVAVYDIHAHEERNTESALADGHVLQGFDLVEALDVEHASHLAGSDVARHLSVHSAARGDVARHHEVELADLLLKRHARHELADVLVHGRQFLARGKG